MSTDAQGPGTGQDTDMGQEITDDGSGGTPATSPGLVSGAEGDSDQLPLEDTLLDRAVDEQLDEGYSPPEHRPGGGRLETEAEQAEGQSLDSRLAEEEPEVWDAPDRGARQPDRAGRLVEDDADATHDRTSSTAAVDAGVAGGAATAEEAAMHLIDEDEV